MPGSRGGGGGKMLGGGKEEKGGSEFLSFFSFGIFEGFLGQI